MAATAVSDAGGWQGCSGGRIQKHGPALGVGCKAGPYRATNSRFTWPDGDNGDIAKVVPFGRDEGAGDAAKA